MNGNGYAQNCIGFIYAEGRGVTKDDAKAVEWYQKSAAQGNACGQCNLGLMYADGRGVLEDDATAVEWLKKSAVQGNENAIAALKSASVKAYAKQFWERHGDEIISEAIGLFFNWANGQVNAPQPYRDNDNTSLN